MQFKTGDRVWVKLPYRRKKQGIVCAVPRGTEIFYMVETTETDGSVGKTLCWEKELKILEEDSESK